VRSGAAPNKHACAWIASGFGAPDVFLSFECKSEGEKNAQRHLGRRAGTRVVWKWLPETVEADVMEVNVLRALDINVVVLRV